MMKRRTKGMRFLSKNRVKGKKGRGLRRKTATEQGYQAVKISSQKEKELPGVVARLRAREHSRAGYH